MGRWSVDHVTTRDSARIRYGLWKPENTSVGRCVVFLNGRTEWIEKYDYLPERLGLGGDTAFLTMDHRGQGASDGVRAHIDSYDVFADDVAAVIERAIGPKVPYVLMAHSMGGLISLYSVLTKRLKPQSLVLCSPLLGLPEKPVPSIIAKPLSHFLAKTPFTKMSSGAGQFSESTFEGNPLTHSKEMFDRIEATPYPLGGVTFGWVNATFRALSTVFSHESLKSLAVPVLVLGSNKDTVVDNRSFNRWVDQANRCAKSPVQIFWIADALHELLAEEPRYQDQAIEHIKQWFSQFIK